MSVATMSHLLLPRRWQRDGVRAGGSVLNATAMFSGSCCGTDSQCLFEMSIIDAVRSGEGWRIRAQHTVMSVQVREIQNR